MAPWLSFGGISFCQKMGMSLGGWAVGLLLTHFQYVPDQIQTAFTLTGIALSLSVIPGLFHLVTGLVMFKYRITDNFYNDMMRNQSVVPRVNEPGLKELPVT